MSKDTNGEEEPQLSSGRTVKASFLMLPIIYVLSLGPFVYVVEHIGTRPTGAVDTLFGCFYFPLHVLHRYTWCKEPLDWYMNLWM